jgi:hypothetical protein
MRVSIGVEKNHTHAPHLIEYNQDVSIVLHKYTTNLEISFKTNNISFFERKGAAELGPKQTEKVNYLKLNRP